MPGFLVGTDYMGDIGYIWGHPSTDEYGGKHDMFREYANINTKDTQAHTDSKNTWYKQTGPMPP